MPCFFHPYSFLEFVYSSGARSLDLVHSTHGTNQAKLKPDHDMSLLLPNFWLPYVFFYTFPGDIPRQAAIIKHSQAC